jgi:hypothetical protein
MARTQPTATNTKTGVSLSRGPALILGTILAVAGLYFLYKQHTFVKLSHFPNGKATVGGKVFFGIFGVNGWTGELTAAAGALLLFGAAQHLLAKAISLIVGVVLAVVAVWALVNHHSALGLFAASIWTIVLFGACALLLLFNSAIPRRKTTAEPAATRNTAPVYRATPAREPETPVRSVPPAGDSAAPAAEPTRQAGAVRARPAGETLSSPEETNGSQQS